MIELEQGTSFPEEMQTCCRVHRPGADEIQNVYRSVTKDSCDQVIDKRLSDNQFNIQVAGLEAEGLERESIVPAISQWHLLFLLRPGVWILARIQVRAREMLAIPYWYL